MLGGHTGQRKDATEIRLFITPYTQISHNLQKLLSSIGLNYSKMDGPRDCPAKWSKSDKDEYHMISLKYHVISLQERHTWTYLQNGSRLTDIEKKKLTVTKGEGSGWRDKLGIWDEQIHSTVHKIGFPGGASGKETTCQCRRCRWETQVRFLGWEDPLEKGMATHSSILAGESHGPWTEEPGKLQSIGSQRVRHNWSNLARMHVYKIGKQLGPIV